MGDDTYAKRVLLTATGDAVSRGIASNLAKHGCRCFRLLLFPLFRSVLIPFILAPIKAGPSG